jgi:hypothetical protein
MRRPPRLATGRSPHPLVPRRSHLHQKRPAEFDFSAGDLELLAETCRILDLVEQLRVASSPPVVEALSGPKVNPALIELRQQRIELRRHLGQLNLPDIDDEGEELPAEADLRSQRARRAARIRWDRGARV